MKQIAKEIRIEFPDLNEIIQQDFYMDDLDADAETVAETISKILLVFCRIMVFKKMEFKQ